MIVVSGVIEIDPADHAAAVAATTPMAAASRAEDGCHAYAFWVDPNDPGRFRVFEEWESDAALEAHFQSPHMATFRQAMGGIRVLSRQIHRYEVSERKDL